jgi:hypothetical protein
MTNEMQNLDLAKVIYSLLFRSSYEIFEPFLLEILGRSLIDEKRLTRPLLDLVFFEKKFEFFERFCFSNFSKNGSEKFEKNLLNL